MMKKILLTCIAVAFSILMYAQDSTAVKDTREATGLRAEGKIYVVLVVSVTVLIGLFIYLIRLDRKINKLEKKIS
jgi:CcmD family protein